VGLSFFTCPLDLSSAMTAKASLLVGPHTTMGTLAFLASTQARLTASSSSSSGRAIKKPSERQTNIFVLNKKNFEMFK
jgi:hypothetical protein